MTISIPRPARAAPRVSVRFGADPTPTVWISRRDELARDLADDFLLKADIAVRQQYNLPLRVLAQRLQGFDQGFCHFRSTGCFQLAQFPQAGR